MVGYTIEPSYINEAFRTRNPLNDNGGIYGKAGGSHGCFVVSTIFMLGIWLKGDRLKEIFGSTQSIVGWYVKHPDLVGFFIC